VLYPYAKYDQAFVPEYNAGAMENIGAVTITEAYVFRSKPTQARVDRRAITILHEQAHMWFGDLVTMRWWNDLWLNESFAEFVSHLAAVNSGWPDAWTTFQAAEKSWGYRQDQLPSTHPIVAEIRDLADVEVNFDGITYAKGAAVLRQLVAWVGQDNFLTGVSAYLKKYAWGNASLADLLAELTAASGRDLGDWSRLWLEEAGVTLLRPELTGNPADGVTSLTIQQSLPAIYLDQADSFVHPIKPTLRPSRLGLAGYRLTDSLTQLWRLETDIDGAATAVEAAAGQDWPDLLLVNDGDLAYAKCRFDEHSLNTALTEVARMTDSLGRSLVHGALWDATRDGELPASRYIAAVLKALPAESSPTAIQSLLSQLRTAVLFYVTPQRRAMMVDQVSAELFHLAAAASAGSDAQLQFFKAFTALASHQDHLDQLDELRSGPGQLPGLTMDTDLAWEVLIALVAGGRRGEADIAAALEQDTTTKGLEWAASARAALPQPEAKATAFTTACFDQSITNATQRSIIAGFGQPAQAEQLAAFVEPYFDQLSRTWAERSREMATNIVQGLYPLWCLDQPEVDLMARTDQWLEQLGEQTPALRRLVIENRAMVVRAKLAQACDATVS
jgi:aminopeptidase N